MVQKASILTLLNLKGIGPKSISEYLKVSNDLNGVDQIKEAIQSGFFKRLVEIPSSDEIDRVFEDAVKTIQSCTDSNINILIGNELPIYLKRIPNPPVLLFTKGNFEVLHTRSLAIIGTREPTNFGKESAFRISRTLTEKGWAIVSGLAKGCDFEAHAGCLAAQGRTVAVLAHGFGMIYPKEHEEIAEKILEGGGTLLTEYAPGCPPSKGSFIERDRLQSGLSHGVIVVETDVKGGTMHTIKHALGQGKIIAAISHPESMMGLPQSQGNSKLIKEKIARPLADKASLIQFSEELTAITNVETKQENLL